eukprot:82552-Lingulodinium_polyedra.AAC.1
MAAVRQTQRAVHGQEQICGDPRVLLLGPNWQRTVDVIDGSSDDHAVLVVTVDMTPCHTTAWHGHTGLLAYCK